LLQTSTSSSSGSSGKKTAEEDGFVPPPPPAEADDFEWDERNAEQLQYNTKATHGHIM